MRKINKEQRREYLKKYYQEHKDIIKARSAKRQVEKKTEIREYRKKYQLREGYKAQHAIRHKRWYLKKKQNNPEYFVQIKLKERRPENRIKKTEYTRQYRKNNRAWYLAQKNKRRFREKSGVGITEQDIKSRLELQNNLCFYCQKDITTTYTIDHIVPLCKGGLNSPDNFDLVCKSCNSSKGAKSKNDYKIWLFLTQQT